jgi:signal transduction histidine kinase
MSGAGDRARRLRAATVFGLPVLDVALALVFTSAAIVWIHAAAAAPTLGDLAYQHPVPPGGPPIVKPVMVATTQPIWPALLLNLPATVALAFRRRWPYLGFVFAFTVVFIVHGSITWPGFAALLVLAYSIVAHGRRMVLSMAGLAVVAVLVAAEFSGSVPATPGWVTPFAILVPIGLFATVIRTTRARADAAARRALALERERDAATRAAIAEERARIARDLHDVVSHHVSVMIIQAGAASSVLPSRPDLAADALGAIRRSGQDAMAELRHLVGSAAPLDDSRHPQPGLSDIDELVATVRAAGQPVHAVIDIGALSRGIELTAYRVVQEGLTNALRYAPGARTYVEIGRVGDTLVVEVRNDTTDATGAPIAAVAPTMRPTPALPSTPIVPTSPAPAALPTMAPPTTPTMPVPAALPITPPGTGTGLIGLTERLRVFDGTLDCGRRPGGGFRLRARIPLTPAPVAAPDAAEAISG